MPRIKTLPESVKNKIAAGEVIEGPFSVVKELIENSIDAAAKNIDVEIFDSGLKKIVIKDNGTGIFREDLPLAIKNHATSKISDISDIERIASYGFRGEALASISSISRLTIITRSADEPLGGKLIADNEHTEISEYAGGTGTVIIIENLFYNIPARKKFLKSKGVEQRKVREIFLKTALAKPELSFSLSIDGKRTITLPASKEISERIEQIYGKNVAENFYFERLKDLKVEISGFLSRPDFLKSSRSMQVLYVNNRLVEYKYLGYLISKAYEAVASKGTYPAAIIFINIDPALLDVNIHPAKKEVKFFDQNYINGLIVHLCETALGKVHSLVPDRLSSGRAFNKNKMSGMENSRERDEPAFEQKLPLGSDHFHTDRETVDGKTNISYSDKTAYPLRSFLKDTEKLYNRIENSCGFTLLGIAFSTYIIIEKDNALSFIDFHAAHERYIYDELIKKDLNRETQSLIFPQVIELPVEDYQIFLEKKDYFIDTAFDIDIFSENSIVVRGIPAILKDMNIEGFFSDLIEALKNEGNYIEDIKKIIAEKAACHAAKRSGDTLSAEDANLITARVLNGDQEKRCPHGRPYIYNLAKTDLEKIFKR